MKNKEVLNLLEKIANSLNTKIVRFDSVQETIDNNIYFAKIVEPKHLSKEEIERIEQKSKVY